jgi:putative endonuclease
MHYLCVLESIATPGRHYIGYTTDLHERVRKHQADVSSHTAKYRPWKLKAYFAFETEEIARRFELYLKSGSGRAFYKKQFM